MSMFTKDPSTTRMFVAMIRSALPEMIQDATDGTVVQTRDRGLPAGTEEGEDAFQVFLSSGVSYQVRVQQVRFGGAVDEEAGCQRCGELTSSDELDEHGVCPSCLDRPVGDDGNTTEVHPTEWYQQHRRHYPFIAKGPPSPARLRYLSDLLASHSFRVAKTAVRNPHEYTLRHEWRDVGDEVYNEVIRMIREHGNTEWFGGYPWRMLNANGFKYWSYYSSYVEEVIVLNRKPLPGADAE